MNELTVAHSTTIINTFDDAQKAATAMSASGFFQDAKSAAQAIVKILAGQELGFGPFASMTGVAIIQGKPAIGANLQAAAIKRTGKYNYRVIEMTDKVVDLEFFEAGKSVGHSKFTMDDAQAAGLNSKDNWKKFPRNMLFARAISNGVKWYAPDIFNGATVYTPDELGASEDGDGNIITVVPTEPVKEMPVAVTVDPEPQPAAAPSDITEEEYFKAFETLDSKGNKYGEKTSDQLAWIFNKATGDKKLAAEILLRRRAVEA